MIVTCTIPVNSVTIWSWNYFFYFILYKIPFIACWLVQIKVWLALCYMVVGICQIFRIGGRYVFFWIFARVMVFNSIFNNISVILWWSVLLVEETGVPGESHSPVTSYWQTLSHNAVSSTPCHEWGSNSQFSEYDCSDSFTRLYLSKVELLKLYTIVFKHTDCRINYVLYCDFQNIMVI